MMKNLSSHLSMMEYRFYQWMMKKYGRVETVERVSYQLIGSAICAWVKKFTGFPGARRL